MEISRRNFLTKLIVAVPFFSLVLESACKTKKEELAKCTTSSDILGPYFRENAPSRINLNVNNEAGTKLIIRGTVYGVNCLIPLINAKVEVWHADTSGEYDNTTSDYEYRGTMYTDATGNYEYSTIVPGRYLNGNTYRPSHIHYRITANKHKELVTQLYFSGDPYIEVDPLSSDESATERIITLSDDGNGNKSGDFDIKLTPEN